LSSNSHLQEVIGGIPCAVSLGDLISRQEIEDLLFEFSELPPGQRLAVWAERLIGTPFEFESNLPILSEDMLRVNLANLDCITFIYVVIALSRADSFEQFVRQLKVLRYDVPDVEAASGRHAASGSFLHFVEESLLERAIEQGWLTDVTSTLVTAECIIPMAVDLRVIRRPAAFDFREQLVAPVRGERAISHTFIRAVDLQKMDVKLLQDGDIIVFAKDPTTAQGDLRHILVRHLGIVKKQAGAAYFIHSSRHFARREHATNEARPSHTGIFYDDDRRCEQLGVDFCGAYAGDEYIIKKDSDTYYAMDMSRLRTVQEYAESNFTGIKVLRLLPKPKNA